MPARVCSQDPKVKESFRRIIRDKVERDKVRTMADVDGEVPSWAAWALKPLVSAAHDLLRARDSFAGDVGEGKASVALRTMLPNECTLMNDVVLEVEPDEFIQVDHLVVAPSGVFLVETKAWRGAFVCHGGIWKRKTGKSWERCKSPTWQNRRHHRLFQKWIVREAPDLPSLDWSRPIILFTSSSYLKVSHQDMPVFDSCAAMARWVRKQAAIPILGESERNRIVNAVQNASRRIGPR